MTTWNDFITRYTEGSRESPALTLSNQNVRAVSSIIGWDADTPANTSLTIETAYSMDGGLTWSAWETCTKGQPVPSIANLESLESVKFKLRQKLYTSDTKKTPTLKSLSITILTVGNNVVIGPDKSALTAWDSISLAWSPDRLSLVVNDEEACFIENPGLPSALGSHVYIGTDRNGNNAINTLVDELRIDKVYRDIATRTAWHKMGIPFYTSEDMKQWPGYMKLETEGLKVYDSQDQLRVLLGSWLKDAVRKYGLKIIGGEIYSSLISTGEEGDNRGTIKINHYQNPSYPEVNWGSIDFYGGSGKKIMSLDTGAQQPALRFYDESIESQIAAGFIGLGTGSSTKELYIASWDSGVLISTANESITMGATSGNAGQRGVALTGIRGNLSPYVDGGGNLGASDRRWWTGYIVYTQTGDLAFSEKTCAICDGKFEDGDILVLLNKTILDNGYTFTIPVHEKCKNIEKTIEVEVPEMTTKYRVNDRGEVEEYKDMYFEEIEEEVMTIHPDYELDENTGKFKRKMNDWNLELFGEKEILAGVMASERVAKVRDNVITKKPKLKKIQIRVGQNKEAGIEN